MSRWGSLIWCTEGVSDVRGAADDCHMSLRGEVIAAVRSGLDRVYRDYMNGNDEWSLSEWPRRVKTALCGACRTWNESCYLAASDVTRVQTH